MTCLGNTANLVKSCLELRKEGTVCIYRAINADSPGQGIFFQREERPVVLFMFYFCRIQRQLFINLFVFPTHIKNFSRQNCVFLAVHLKLTARASFQFKIGQKKSVWSIFSPWGILWKIQFSYVTDSESESKSTFNSTFCDRKFPWKKF